jgi:hypothetical protein
MSQSDYEQQLKADGFTEIAMQALAPRPGRKLSEARKRAP